MSGTIRRGPPPNAGPYFETNTIAREFYDLVVGEQLGVGVSRVVYVYRPDPSLVVKFETSADREFQNVAEWHAWGRVADGRESVWLAPCVSISDCGSVLIQRRTSPVALGDLPARLPAWMTDRKRSNFGLYEGRVVAHDYGMLWPSFGARLTVARWRDE